MALMSLRSRYHVKASMLLMRADHVCIPNYIRSLLNMMLRRNVLVRTGLEHAHYSIHMHGALAIRAVLIIIL